MMKDLQQRVPFIYNSLLYKLDNIHLKQTYKGKPYNRKSEGNHNKQSRELPEPPRDSTKRERNQQTNRDSYKESRDSDHIPHEVKNFNGVYTEPYHLENDSRATTEERTPDGINTNSEWIENNSYSDNSVDSDLSIDGGKLSSSVKPTMKQKHEKEKSSTGIPVVLGNVEFRSAKTCEQSYDLCESDVKDESFGMKEQVETKNQHNENVSNHLNLDPDDKYSEPLMDENMGVVKVKSVERNSKGFRNESSHNLDLDIGDHDQTLEEQNIDDNTLGSKNVSFASICQASDFEFDKPIDNEKLHKRNRNLNVLNSSSNDHQSNIFVKVYENTSNLQDVFSSLLGTTRSRSVSVDHKKIGKHSVLDQGNHVQNITDRTLKGQSIVHQRDKQGKVQKPCTRTPNKSMGRQDTDLSLSMDSGRQQYQEHTFSSKIDTERPQSTRDTMKSDTNNGRFVRKQPESPSNSATLFKKDTILSICNMNGTMDDVPMASITPIKVDRKTDQSKESPCALTSPPKSRSILASTVKGTYKAVDETNTVFPRSIDRKQNASFSSCLQIEKKEFDSEKLDELMTLSDGQGFTSSSDEHKLNKRLPPTIELTCSNMGHGDLPLNNNKEPTHETNNEIYKGRLKEKVHLDEKVKPDETHMKKLDNFNHNDEQVHGQKQKEDKKQKVILMKTCTSTKTEGKDESVCCALADDTDDTQQYGILKEKKKMKSGITFKLTKKMDKCDPSNPLKEVYGKNEKTNQTEKDEMEKAVKTSLKTISEDVLVNGKEEVNKIGKEEVNEIGKEEVNEVGKEKVNEIGKEKVNEIGKEEVNEVGNEEVNKVGNEEVSEIGNEEVNEVGKEEVNEVGNKEIIQSCKNDRKVESKVVKPLTPIIIKRLLREESKKNGETEGDPSPELPLKFSYSGDVGKDKEDDYMYSQKMMAERLANLPAITGQNVSCPTCGEQVLNTGKKETSCKDSVHQMLARIPSLQTTAQQYGLVVHNIAGDGNCMFSAVIDQLKISGDFSFTAHTLRSAAVEYLQENPCQEDGSHLSCFLTDESWEDYLKRMGKDGEWGDHITLIAITELIGISVTVLNASGTATHLHPNKTLEPEEMNTNENVYLGYVGGSHYVSLRPMDWQKTWSLNAKMRRIKRLLSLEESQAQPEDKTDDNAADQGCHGERKCELIKFNHAEILNSLSTDIFCVDSVSRVPVMHLSYIILELIKRDDFFKYISPYPGEVNKSWIKSQSNGTIRLNLTVGLYNFPRYEFKQNYDDKYALSDIEFLGLYSTTYGKYEISNDKFVSSIFRNEGENLRYTIDTEETYPGYLRLRSTRPVYLPGTGEPPEYMTKMFSDKYYLYRLPFTLTSKDEYEFLPTLICEEWPFEAHGWINRERASGWPSSDLITKITKQGCSIAQRAHPNSTEKEYEFQFIFHAAEEMLAAELTDDMKYCFYVFQTLVRFQTRKLKVILPPYFLITTLMYACESIRAETWRNSCGGCVLYMTQLLLYWLKTKFLPHYFIPRNNLIETWERSKLKLICAELESLRQFPCMVLHFLSEAHGFTNSWLIDSVMAFSKRFKIKGDRQWIVENVFNPTTFSLARCYLSKRKNFRFALNELNESFEKNLVWTEACLSFKDFLDHFILTVDNEKTKRLFMSFVNREIDTSDVEHGTGEITLAEFLGQTYTGKYLNKRLAYEDSDPVVWDDINDFLDLLLRDGEYEETATIARCLIEKTKSEIKTGEVEFGEIEDAELRSQIEKSNKRTKQDNYERRNSYYMLLFICYIHLNKKEDFKEFINELEEAVLEKPTRPALSAMSKIFKTMNLTTKAREFQERMETVRTNDTLEDNVFAGMLTMVLSGRCGLLDCKSCGVMYELD